MDAGGIVQAGGAGGVRVIAVHSGLNILKNLIIPYDNGPFGGMTAMDDPAMLLFLLYPFVLALAAAWMFDLVRRNFTGSVTIKGIAFGVLLFAMVAVPLDSANDIPMDRPASFYAGNRVWAIIGLPLLGTMYAKLEER